MKTTRITLRVVIVTVALFCGVTALAQPDASSDAATLRQTTQRMLDAVATGDRASWEDALDPGLVQVDENGQQHDKAAILAALAPLPAGLKGSLRIDKFEPHFFGDVAVVATEAQEQLDYHGQALHSRFRSIDTWRRTKGRWTLIGQQVTAVLRDPPAIDVPKERLCDYNGTYALTRDITGRIVCTEHGFVFHRSGRPDTTYLPEAVDVFFVAGQPRSRRLFIRDAQGHPIAFVDRREGEDIRWTRSKE